jgi:hypothetical protein
LRGRSRRTTIHRNGERERTVAEQGAIMRAPNLFALLALAAAVAPAGALADEAKYPDIRGVWERPGAAQWDPTKPPGLKQEAPLTPEFQKVLEDNIANAAAGGQEYNPQVVCRPSGMPRLMIAYEPFEIIITPDVTYMRFDQMGETRRIYTDGRGFPDRITPRFDGYSIGKWVEPDADGRYGALEIETRGMRGPRLLDANGLPLHPDNATVVKERVFLDPANRDVLRDMITTIDHAYTRPWTVTRGYRRLAGMPAVETNCEVENRYLWLGKETYFISLDGYLMPTKKNQPPPDLRNFATTAR